MLKPFSTTGIGSLPHRSAEEACSAVLSSFDIPFWPQLPKVSFKELMIPQYSEGLPFVRIDAERQTVWVERNGTDELERFYESCTDTSRIAISQDFASGLHAMLRQLKAKRLPLFKGHVTGPVTYTLSLKDNESRPVFFDEEMREISLMLLKAKTRWQIDLFRQFSDRVIIFIDEPILSALGSSSYLGVSAEEAFRLIRELVSTIRELDAIAGIHCCGNADWPLVLGSGADIVNFDAFDYADTLALYPENVKGFLENGGSLAWGIVPTSEAIALQTPETIRARFDRAFEQLSRNVPEGLLRSRMLLTPSCGTGSRTVDETLKVFQLLMRLKEDLS